MTWEEAKEQIARDHGYESWNSLRFCHSMNYGLWEIYLYKAAKLYARGVADKAFDAGYDQGMYIYPGKEEFMKQLDI